MSNCLPACCLPVYLIAACLLWLPLLLPSLAAYATKTEQKGQKDQKGQSQFTFELYRGLYMP